MTRDKLPWSYSLHDSYCEAQNDISDRTVLQSLSAFALKNLILIDKKFLIVILFWDTRDTWSNVNHASSRATYVRTVLKTNIMPRYRSDLLLWLLVIAWGNNHTSPQTDAFEMEQHDPRAHHGKTRMARRSMLRCRWHDDWLDADKSTKRHRAACPTRKECSACPVPRPWGLAGANDYRARSGRQCCYKSTLDTGR